MALLLCDDDNRMLMERLNGIYLFDALPNVKLPLHATLYFFSQSSGNFKQRAIQWLKKIQQPGPVEVDVTGVSTFSKLGKEFVYILSFKSKSVNSLNTDINSVFKDSKKDRFAFTPHLSLFFPQKKIPERQKKKIINLFGGIKKLTFDKLAFICEKNGGMYYIHVQHLKK